MRSTCSYSHTSWLRRHSRWWLVQLWIWALTSRKLSLICCSARRTPPSPSVHHNTSKGVLYYWSSHSGPVRYSFCPLFLLAGQVPALRAARQAGRCFLRDQGDKVSPNPQAAPRPRAWQRPTGGLEHAQRKNTFEKSLLSPLCPAECNSDCTVVYKAHKNWYLLLLHLHSLPSS